MRGKGLGLLNPLGIGIARKTLVYCAWWGVYILSEDENKVTGRVVQFYDHTLFLTFPFLRNGMNSESQEMNESANLGHSLWLWRTPEKSFVSFIKSICYLTRTPCAPTRHLFYCFFCKNFAICISKLRLNWVELTWFYSIELRDYSECSRIYYFNSSNIFCTLKSQKKDFTETAMLLTSLISGHVFMRLDLSVRGEKNINYLTNGFCWQRQQLFFLSSCISYSLLSAYIALYIIMTTTLQTLAFMSFHESLLKTSKAKFLNLEFECSFIHKWGLCRRVLVIKKSIKSAEKSIDVGLPFLVGIIISAGQYWIVIGIGAQGVRLGLFL